LLLYADVHDVFEREGNVEELVMRWLTWDTNFFVTQFYWSYCSIVFQLTLPWKHDRTFCGLVLLRRTPHYLKISKLNTVRFLFVHLAPASFTEFRSILLSWFDIAVVQVALSIQWITGIVLGGRNQVSFSLEKPHWLWALLLEEFWWNLERGFTLKISEKNYWKFIVLLLIII